MYICIRYVICKKPMKTTEDLKKYQSMKGEELAKELSVLEKKIVDFRLKIAAGKMENHSELGKTKKNIARIKTLMMEINE